VVQNPAAVYRLLEFATFTVENLADEVPEMHTYVLDVAFGPGPERATLVVEINGMLDAGLYASDPLQVTRALAAQAVAA
jgi:hypothetical protein